MDNSRRRGDPVREVPVPNGDRRGGPRAFPFELSKVVSSSASETDPETTSITVPYDGRITKIVIGWPAGTDKGVGVKIRDSTGHQYVPYNTDQEYIAGDDFTHPFRVQVDIEEEDELVAEFVNSTTSSHLVNVFPEIVEESDR